MLKQYLLEQDIPLALNYDFALITLSKSAPKGTPYTNPSFSMHTPPWTLQNCTAAALPATIRFHVTRHAVTARGLLVCCLHQLSRHIWCSD